MQKLIYIVRSLKEYVVLTLLVVFSLALLSLNDNTQIRTVRAYTVGMVGSLQSVISIIPNVFVLQKENALLRQQNVNLMDEVSRLREARLENARLRGMLQLQERSPYPLVSADVVGKSLHLMRNTITLNVGERDGILPDMPIISEEGLVGRVIATSSRYAVGQLMFNRDFRASARVQRTRVPGIIGWNGGDVLVLNNVAKTQDVAVGDVVLTSDYSNVYPRDLRIGVVVHVSERDGGLFREIHVKPSVDFSRLEHAFVIRTTPDQERAKLEAEVHTSR